MQVYQPIFDIVSVARTTSLADVARTVCQTVGTAIIPNLVKIFKEVITAKIGTSIASIVLRRISRELTTKTETNRTQCPYQNNE